MPAQFDFRRVRGLQEELDRLPEVRGGIINRVTLARDVELRAERNVPVALLLHDGSERRSRHFRLVVLLVKKLFAAS